MNKAMILNINIDWILNIIDFIEIFNENVILYSSFNKGKEIMKDTLLSSSLLPFLKIKQTSKTLFSWIKSSLLFTMVTVIINILLVYLGYKPLFGREDSIVSSLLSNYTFLKWYFSFTIVFSILMIFYYLISLILFIMFSKNKFTISEYLPISIINWLKSIEEISKLNNKGYFIEYYLRLMLLYVFLVFLFLFTIYLMS